MPQKFNVKKVAFKKYRKNIFHTVNQFITYLIIYLFI